LGAGPLTETAAVTDKAGEEGATRALTSFQPKLRDRVQAVVCRNHDGRMSNGQPGQSRAELETAIRNAITLTNTIMATANIELVFYPTADLEIVNNTFLNQDFVLPASALAKLKQEPPLTKAESKR
jgi:hypothetical protein